MAANRLEYINDDVFGRVVGRVYYKTEFGQGERFARCRHMCKCSPKQDWKIDDVYFPTEQETSSVRANQSGEEAAAEEK